MKTEYRNTDLNFDQVRKDYQNKFGRLPPYPYDDEYGNILRAVE